MCFTEHEIGMIQIPTGHTHMILLIEVRDFAMPSWSPVVADFCEDSGLLFLVPPNHIQIVPVATFPHNLLSELEWTFYSITVKVKIESLIDQIGPPPTQLCLLMLIKWLTIFCTCAQESFQHVSCWCPSLR